MTGGSTGGGGMEGDVVSEAFELCDEPAGGAFGVAAAEVVAAGLTVQLAGCEHVPAGAEDRVFDGAERAPVSAAGPQPLVLGGQVDVLAAGGGHGGLGERGVEPFGAVAGLAGAAFAGGAVVAGALAGPAGEVALAWELAHVGADLGQDRLGGTPLDAGERAEQLNRFGERGELLLDAGREQLDLLVEEIEVGEDGGDDQRVLGVEAADERLLERRDLRAQLAPGELGEQLRVGAAGDERLQH